MRRATMVLVLALAAMACSLPRLDQALGFGVTATPSPYPTLVPVTPSLTPTPGPPSFTVTIVLDPSLTGQDPSLVKAWTAYANARADWIRANIPAQQIAAGGYHRTFDEEVAGRTALALAWKAEKKVTPGLQNSYLDQLLKVYEASFIREYTWIYFAASDWEQPHGLYLTAFDSWARAHLTKPLHVVETLATVQVTIVK